MAKILERDWAFVREGVENLEQYLLSPELYWPLGRLAGSGGGATQLTVGNLVLSQKRLSAVDWPAEEQQRLDEANRQIETVRAHWRANWAKKAQREVTARLKLWMDYVHEVLGETGRRSGGYAYEVRWRVILQLLMDDLDEHMVTEEQALGNLDSRLRSNTTMDGFVWEPEVERGFPQVPFWYLYIKFRE